MENWQTPVALLIVAAALFFVIRGAVKKRKTPGCAGGCACPTDKFKASLKH
jgi:hypothetical protein